MNWTQVRCKYPKAWDKCRYYFLPNIQHPENIRDLYDFFDANEIYVEIFYYYDVIPEWHWCIDLKNENNYKENREPIVTNRTEAEEKAFECAFKILENKLNENN